MTKRVSLDFDEKEIETLNKLRDQLCIGTYKATILKGLALLDMVTEHQAAGGKLVLRNTDGTEEVVRML